jgi:hypothetical protein
MKLSLVVIVSIFICAVLGSSLAELDRSVIMELAESLEGFDGKEKLEKENPESEPRPIGLSISLNPILSADKVVGSDCNEFFFALLRTIDNPPEIKV